MAAILGHLATAAPAQAARLPAVDPVERAGVDEAFSQARQAAIRLDADRFERLARRAADPLVGHYLDYWRLRLRLAGRGSGVGLDDDFRGFIDRHPGSLVADLARRDWLFDLAKRGEWAMFDRHYPNWVLRDDVQLDCWAWLGAVRTGRPLPAEAAQAIFRPRELGEGCGTLVGALADERLLSRADLWRRLKLSLEGNALASVRRVGALMSLDSGAIDRALSRPSKVLAAGADTPILVIAASQLARENPEAAAERLADLRLPDEERAFVMSQIAAHSMRKLSPRSIEWARQSLGATASDDTWVWLARAALREGDWQTLSAVVGRMSPAARDDVTWTYWQARAHLALGRPAQAETALRSIAGEFGFYGQLAAEELGTLTMAPARAAPPADDEIAEASSRPGFLRALRFYEMGMRAEGNREWNYELRGLNDRQLLAAAEWACRQGILDRCVNTADRTRDEHDFALRFVTPFIEQLSPAAEDRGLDPAWVYGLIRQESRFIMQARSSAGAQGLMQIIPPTARWIAVKLGVRNFRMEQLHDLGTNLRFGTYYLRSVLDDLDGSPLLASAGYNAGPNRPRSWRSTLPSTVEGAVFAEIIPFPETRDYVKKVLSNATYYAAMLSGQPQSLKARLGSVAPVPRGDSQLP